MKKFDVVFAIICGILVAEVLREFGYFFNGLLFLFLPILSLLCLWLAEHLGKKYLFIFQASKHVLVGTFATIIDLKVFEIIFWLLSFGIFAKTVSFIISVIIKFIGNKFWTFKKIENGIAKVEFFKFLIFNLAGLLIDVSSFAFLTKIILLENRTSVIISAVIAGIWNFCSDKFFVFKK